MIDEPPAIEAEQELLGEIIAPDLNIELQYLPDGVTHKDLVEEARSRGELKPLTYANKRFAELALNLPFTATYIFSREVLYHDLRGHHTKGKEDRSDPIFTAATWEDLREEDRLQICSELSANLKRVLRTDSQSLFAFIKYVSVHPDAKIVGVNMHGLVSQDKKGDKIWVVEPAKGVQVPTQSYIDRIEAQFHPDIILVNVCNGGRYDLVSSRAQLHYVHGTIEADTSKLEAKVAEAKN